MGDRTRGDLLQQAGLAAGNDQASSFVRGWLNDWLSRTAKSWSWPLLKKRIQNVAIPAGTRSVSIGVGFSTTVQGKGTLTTHHLHRLLGGFVMWRAQSGFSPRGRASVRPLYDGDIDKDEDMNDPTVGRGSPSTVKLRQTDDGVLTLYFDPIPNVAIYAFPEALWIPPAMDTSTTGDTLKPWYPNDRTLEMAMEAAIMTLDAGGTSSSGLDEKLRDLGSMVIDDRDFDGEQEGDNQVMALDPSVFL